MKPLALLAVSTLLLVSACGTSRSDRALSGAGIGAGAGAVGGALLGDPLAGAAIGGKGSRMTLGTILLIVLILLLVGALPTWPYSSRWSYYPSGGVGLILLILIVLLAAGRI